MSLLNSASLVVTPNGYKAGTLYSVIPNTTLGDMTVVRATTATRVNSAGLIESMAVNVPRLDYSNGTCPSILVEPQRTNIVLYSEQFNNAAWTTSASNATVTANTTISPDGTQNADTVVFGASGYLYQQFSIVGLASATFSIYAKTATQIPVFGGASPSGTDVYTTVNVGNGWFRQILVRTFTSGGTGVLQTLPFGNNITAFLWGCQLEAGSYPTSYIPTTSAAVTRNDDVISKTGISSLIGQTEGTLYAEVIIKNTENQICASIQRSGINYIFISQFNNKRQFSLRANNVTIFNYNVGVFLSGTNKVALVYNTNGNISAFLNGVKVSTLSTSAFAFSNTLDSLQIFDDGYYSLQNTTNNKSTILFKTALIDAQAISLTTL